MHSNERYDKVGVGQPIQLKLGLYEFARVLAGEDQENFLWGGIWNLGREENIYE